MYYEHYTIGGELYHHGVEGQKWGVKNGPPYPLGKDKSTGKRLKQTVFISGSSKTQSKDSSYYRKKLPKQITDKIDKMMKDGDTIIVGDAPGIDRQVQDYLRRKRYKNVEIYGPGKEVRYAADKKWKTNPIDDPDHEVGSKEWLAKNKTNEAINKLTTKKESENFDPWKAMNNIDKTLSKKEQDLLGVGNDESTDDIKFFFDKGKNAYLITADYHGKYKDEHPIPGKIIGIAAKKEVRGTGITDKLITDAKKHFSSDTLVAEIDKDNIASQKLFERNGFKKVREADGIKYYTWKNRR